MIDGTEKPKIPLKFAKRIARYKEFRYMCSQQRIVGQRGNAQSSPR